MAAETKQLPAPAETVFFHALFGPDTNRQAQAMKLASNLLSSTEPTANSLAKSLYPIAQKIIGVVSSENTLYQAYKDQLNAMFPLK